MEATYQIPQADVAALTHEVEKINRKAVKLGAPETTVTVGTEITQKGFERREEGLVPTSLGEATTIINFVEVTVTGESPKLGGWEFAATLQPVPELKANIVRAVPGMEIDPSFRTAETFCDHCKTNRYRKTTFLVRHESGDMKQVGSNCLADFTGHKDPHAAAKRLEYLFQIFEMFEAAEEGGFDRGGSGADAQHSVERFLAVVDQAISAHGWLSRSAARNGGFATADRAIAHMFARNDKERDKDMEAMIVDTERIEEAIEWAQEIDENTANDYLWNLKVACSKPFMTLKEAGIVASLLPAYDRDVLKKEQERVRRERSADSTHVGTVGKREVFTLMLLSKPQPIDGYYGTTFLHTFNDADGNEIKWFASNLTGMNEGGTYTLKATVKKHDEYKGVKQTLITRCTPTPKICDACGTQDKNVKQRGDRYGVHCDDCNRNMEMADQAAADEALQRKVDTFTKNLDEEGFATTHPVSRGITGGGQIWVGPVSRELGDSRFKLDEYELGWNVVVAMDKVEVKA